MVLDSHYCINNVDPVRVCRIRNQVISKVFQYAYFGFSIEYLLDG